VSTSSSCFCSSCASSSSSSSTSFSSLSTASIAINDEMPGQIPPQTTAGTFCRHANSNKSCLALEANSYSSQTSTYGMFDSKHTLNRFGSRRPWNGPAVCTTRSTSFDFNFRFNTKSSSFCKSNSKNWTLEENKFCVCCALRKLDLRRPPTMMLRPSSMNDRSLSSDDATSFLLLPLKVSSHDTVDPPTRPEPPTTNTFFFLFPFLFLFFLALA